MEDHNAEGLNRIIVQFYTLREPPLSVSELQKVYAQIKSEAPLNNHYGSRVSNSTETLKPPGQSVVFGVTVSQRDPEYDLLFSVNYEALKQKNRIIRLTLLSTFSETLQKEPSIQNCLNFITPSLLLNTLSQDYIYELHRFFDFSVHFEDHNDMISKCFSDLNMLFVKLGEAIASTFQLRDTWVNNLETEIQDIQAELIQYCKQHFASFLRQLQQQTCKAIKQEPFEPMEVSRISKIKTSIERYGDKVSWRLKVPKWLIPKESFQKNLKEQEIVYRHQMMKTFHVKETFDREIIPQILSLYWNYSRCKKTQKLSVVSGSTASKLTSEKSEDLHAFSFDFLSEDRRKQLFQILNDTVHECAIPESYKEVVKQRFMRTACMNTGFDYNKLFDEPVASDKKQNKSLEVYQIKSNGVEENTYKKKKSGRNKWESSNIEEILLIIVNLYKLFAPPTYFGYVRWYLRLVLRKLDDFKYKFSNFKVLMAIEDIQVPPNQPMEFLRKGDQDMANKKIELQMHQCNLLTLNRSFATLPLLNFQKISELKTPSKVLTICISGFTSQGDFKLQSWKHLIGTHEGEVLALNWQSKTMHDIYTFTWKRLQNLVLNRFVSGVPVFNMLTVVTSLIETYKTNPFFAAMDQAILTGQFLGHVLHTLFPGYLVNLVGFSLGTEVIKQTLIKMKENQSLCMINKVLLIGGVADKRQLETEVLKDVPFETANCYSNDDNILKILYRICKPFNVPCGLGPVNAKNVQNVDCTDAIGGHLEYRRKLDELRKRIELDSDIFYIYDD